MDLDESRPDDSVCDGSDSSCSTQNDNANVEAQQLLADAPLPAPSGDIAPLSDVDKIGQADYPNVCIDCTPTPAVCTDVPAPAVCNDVVATANAAVDAAPPVAVAPEPIVDAPVVPVEDGFAAQTTPDVVAPAATPDVAAVVSATDVAASAPASEGAGTITPDVAAPVAASEGAGAITPDVIAAQTVAAPDVVAARKAPLPDVVATQTPPTPVAQALDAPAPVAGVTGSSAVSTGDSIRAAVPAGSSIASNSSDAASDAVDSTSGSTSTPNSTSRSPSIPAGTANAVGRNDVANATVVRDNSSRQGASTNTESADGATAANSSATTAKSPSNSSNSAATGTGNDATGRSDASSRSDATTRNYSGNSTAQDTTSQTLASRGTSDARAVASSSPTTEASIDATASTRRGASGTAENASRGTSAAGDSVSRSAAATGENGSRAAAENGAGTSRSALSGVSTETGAHGSSKSLETASRSAETTASRSAESPSRAVSSSPAESSTRAELPTRSETALRVESPARSDAVKTESPFRVESAGSATHVEAATRGVAAGGVGGRAGSAGDVELARELGGRESTTKALIGEGVKVAGSAVAESVSRVANTVAEGASAVSHAVGLRADTKGETGGLVREAASVREPSAQRDTIKESSLLRDASPIKESALLRDASPIRESALLRDASPIRELRAEVVPTKDSPVVREVLTAIRENAMAPSTSREALPLAHSVPVREAAADMVSRPIVGGNLENILRGEIRITEFGETDRKKKDGFEPQLLKTEVVAPAAPVIAPPAVVAPVSPAPVVADSGSNHGVQEAPVQQVFVPIESRVVETAHSNDATRSLVWQGENRRYLTGVEIALATMLVGSAFAKPRESAESKPAEAPQVTSGAKSGETGQRIESVAAPIASVIKSVEAPVVSAPTVKAAEVPIVSAPASIVAAPTVKAVEVQTAVAAATKSIEATPLVATTSRSAELINTTTHTRVSEAPELVATTSSTGRHDASSTSPAQSQADSRITSAVQAAIQANLVGRNKSESNEAIRETQSHQVQQQQQHEFFEERLQTQSKRRRDAESLLSKLHGTMPQQPMFRSFKEEAEKKKPEEITEVTSPSPLSRISSRKTYIVQHGDQLVEIGERLFGDARIGFLVADINTATTSQSRLDDHVVVELLEGQSIFLPFDHEVDSFIDKGGKDLDPVNLITIVVKPSLDFEALLNEFSTIV